MVVLTLNCGSSSVKFQLYRWEEKQVLLVGLIERIGQKISLLEARGDKEVKEERVCATHVEALQWMIETLTSPALNCLRSLKDIDAVGHRVVHGGEQLVQSTMIDRGVMETFEELIPLAPLHVPANISGIKAAQRLLPDIPHCAVMDTAWHQTMPPKAYTYSLPYEWYEEYMVRRYGFHGTSYLYTAKRAACLLGKRSADTNLIIAHLGNGASMCAVGGGICIDTTMGFTPLEGLMMGTRCGSIDVAILPYMMEKLGCSLSEMSDYLNKKSGIYGVTEGLTDRRDVLVEHDRGNPKATLAFEMECYRARKQIGAYIACLKELDALVFTAGVGEMSWQYRNKIAGELGIFGIKLDPRKNGLAVSRNCETLISAADSPVKIFVIPTDEELVIASDTVALMEGRYKTHTDFVYDFENPSYRNPFRERALEKDLRKKPELQEVIARPPAESL